MTTGESINEIGIDYLREKEVFSLLKNVISELVVQRPAEPMQWMSLYLNGDAEVQSAKEYLESHNIPAVMSEIAVKLSMHRPENVKGWAATFLDMKHEEHIKTPLFDDPCVTPKRGAMSGFKDVDISPRRKLEEEANDDTPPTSPGSLIRGRSFLGDWCSQLQRYYLDCGPCITCPVYATKGEDSKQTSTKLGYSGIAVDKEEDGWLRITEGGWVIKSSSTHTWRPMGTEAGIVLREPQIPGGFKVGQQVLSAGNKIGVVMGKGIDNENKVLIKWADGDEEEEELPDDEVDVNNLELTLTKRRQRAPTMIWNDNEKLIPPQSIQHQGLPVIVFDLDETLIYAREGPLHARSGVRELFAMLKDKAEVVVWTAGMRCYAQAVVKQIDPDNVVSHCVYRHPKWHTSSKSGIIRKDLDCLGRPIEHTLLVENTSDSIFGNEHNSILLSDYTGSSKSDNTIPQLFKLLRELVNTTSKTVPTFLSSSPLVRLKEVPVGIPTENVKTWAHILVAGECDEEEETSGD